METEKLRNSLDKIKSEKDAEIESLKGEIFDNVNEINELKEKIEEFESIIPTEEDKPGLMDVINEARSLMSVKGFLSDKELESLLKQAGIE